MQLFTIGFTRSSAESFFTRLAGAGVRRVLDVRLNNSSQLAGFAKREDLRYLLRALARIDYEHRPELAPTKELLSAYRERRDWPAYEAAFRALLQSRRVEDRLTPALLDRACLLCSEADPSHCHRRLVGEHLRAQLPRLDLELHHL